MVAFDIPVLDLVYAFFVLVPGFVTYRIGRYVGKVTVTVDQFNKTAYTLIGSGIALSVLTISYSLLTGSQPDSVVTADYSIRQLGMAYILLLGIASTNGVLSGLVIDNWVNAGIKTRRENAWDLTLDNADQPIEARVMTTNGREIHGYIHFYDTNDNGTDISMKYPQYILRYNGEIIETEPIGDYVYVSEDDIGHVFFESEIDDE